MANGMTSRSAALSVGPGATRREIQILQRWHFNDPDIDFPYCDICNRPSLGPVASRHGARLGRFDVR